MSVARTGLPHTSRTPGPTVGAVAAGAALDPTASGNGHRTPTALAPTVLQDRTTECGPRRQPPHPTRGPRVRALVARERAGGPTVTAAEVVAVTGRSRRRAYELLRDARTEQSRGERRWTCASSTAPARPAGAASASPTTRAASAASAPTPASRPPTARASAPPSRPASEPKTTPAAAPARTPAGHVTAPAALPPPHAGTSRPGSYCGGVRRSPRAAHRPPRPGRARPGTAPLRRPARQGRLDRVPRGGRRLPRQGRAAPRQVRPVGQGGRHA